MGTSQDPHKPPNSPRIIPRPEHTLSRGCVSQNALKVLYRLKDCGYQSYLVGGCVRDVLLGHEPKDFDVATDATPEQIRKAFRNCRLIGRRFRLAHIHFGRDYIEVATFRGRGDDDGDDGGDREVRDGRLISDNVYGSIEEDAERRDFTINALYYNIEDFSVRDYVGGFEDLKARRLRLIGDPEQRYREDPVRLLRAVRFAAKLQLDIDPATEKPLTELGASLDQVPPARLFDEVLKLFLTGHAQRTTRLLQHYGLFEALFPDSARCAREQPGYARMLQRAMENTDERVAQNKPVTPAFLFAVLLWAPLQTRVEPAVADGMPLHDAIHNAAEEVISRQVEQIAVPRRFSVPMRDIWHLQPRFKHKVGKKARKLLEHPRFRAGYDFLLLRAEQDESLAELGQYWTELQELSGKALKDALAPQSGKGGRPRRRGKQKSGETGQ